MKPYIHKNNINATVLSIITSSPEDGKIHKDYSIETCAWFLMDLCGFKFDEIDDHSCNGDTFADLIYNIVVTKTHIIYVDNLDFVAYYIINNLIQSFEFILVNKITNDGSNQINIFNKDNTFYSIKIKFGCLKYSIQLLNATQLLRQTGFKLLGDVDYSKLNKNNKDYTLVTAIRSCLKIQPMLWSLFKNGGAGAITIAQYSKEILQAHVERELNKPWTELFPQLDEKQYNYFSQGYRAGLTWINPKYQGQTIHNVTSYDCNKLFPYNMLVHTYPWGEPREVADLKQFKVSFKYYPEERRLQLINPNNILFITTVEVTCNLRDGWVSCFDTRDLTQIGGGLNRVNNAMFKMKLVMTNNDLELLFDAYEFFMLDGDIRNTFKIIGPTYAFNSCRPFKSFVTDTFENYLSYEKGTPESSVAKLVMECAYGSFGTKPIYLNNIIKIDGHTLKTEETNTNKYKVPYIPVAMFVTSYARSMIVRLAHLNINNLVYIDTDSLHIIDADPVGLPLDPVKLGCFKKESIEADAKYLGLKSYVYRDALSGQIVNKIAGLSINNNTKLETVDQYKSGFTAVGWKTCHTTRGSYYFKYTFTAR